MEPQKLMSISTLSNLSASGQVISKNAKKSKVGCSNTNLHLASATPALIYPDSSDAAGGHIYIQPQLNTHHIYQHPHGMYM